MTIQVGRVGTDGLREVRRKAKLTQPEMGRILGVTERTVRRIERNRHSPRPMLRMMIEIWISRMERQYGKRTDIE
jgi:DNA-binding XRE family transcriptional regulator